ncbi:MAG: response regulator [Verrucomicrobiota bacterium]
MKATEAENLRALLVEDERDMNTLIAYHLEKNGIQTTTALDGEIGMMLAVREHFDVVILDLMLPSVSGVEVLRQIMAKRHPAPPVVIVTAVSAEIVHSVGDLRNAAGVVYKPFKPQDLVKLVLSIVHHHHSSEDANHHN